MRLLFLHFLCSPWSRRICSQFVDEGLSWKFLATPLRTGDPPSPAPESGLESVICLTIEGEKSDVMGFLWPNHRACSFCPGSLNWMLQSREIQPPRRKPIHPETVMLREDLEDEVPCVRREAKGEVYRWRSQLGSGSSSPSLLSPYHMDQRWPARQSSSWTPDPQDQPNKRNVSSH